MRLPLRTWLTPLAAGILLLNSACVLGNYSPSAPTTKPPARASAELDFLFYSYRAISGRQQEADPRWLPESSRRIKGFLDQYSKFKSAIPTVSAPARGTYIAVNETAQPSSQTFLCTVNMLTLFVVPCLTENKYETHFDVYVDNVLTRSYRYDIQWKGVQWIGLVPFFWVNLFLTDHEEAFSANVYQFIDEAKQDGLL